ncbi:MAG: ribbon-helix-helix protein, CopG family [Clostridiales bacterium]|jgi:plasmid stability protein|nr:ribbon-helix-helix protein, CopG family [Clostridiales bacterium]
MSAIMIRNLNEETLAKLKQESKKRGMSREELVRKILENFSVAPALLEQQEKYNSLLTMITEVLTLNVQEIKDLRKTLERFLAKGGI